jgi:hypothetical protein
MSTRRTAPPLDTDAPAALSISEVAAVTGLTVHTLRYYERAGLMLEPVERSFVRKSIQPTSAAE